jgi:hypothetical protein
MKKILIPLFAAAFLAAGISAKATVVIPTNVVTKINIQLTYTSPVSTNVTTETKVTMIGKNKTTNNLQVTTVKAVSTPITTANVIQALLAPTAVPKGAYLAHVSSLTTNYFSVRVGNSDILVLTDQITTTNETAPVFSGKMISSETYLTTTYTKGSTRSNVETLVLTTPTLSFNVTALSTVTYTGTTISFEGGLYLYPVSDLSFTVVGTGSDAVGANEIVTGSISANGASVK